jgi:signal recognition particle GTPase
MQKMGGIGKLLHMLPGVGKAIGKLGEQNLDFDKNFAKQMAIINLNYAH